MATSSPPLTDHISCPVCFDVYKDPHALHCLHTFCLTCIKQLQRGSRIECPECREWTNIITIRKDFKTQAFVEWYNKQQHEGDKAIEKTVKGKDILSVSAGPNVSSVCELCNDVSKQVNSKCVTCNQFMCPKCEVIHKAIKSCKDHTIVLVIDMKTSMKGTLKKAINELEQENIVAKMKSCELSLSIRDINKSKDEQSFQMNKYIDDLYEEVEKCRYNLQLQIQQSNDSLVETLATQGTELEEIQKELQDRIDSLVTVVQSEDLVALSKYTNIVENILPDELEKNRTKVSKIDSRVKSPLSVSKGAALNIDKVVQIRSTDTEVYTDILKNNYQIERSLQESYLQRLAMIGNDLWCAACDRLLIYSKDFIRLSEITNDHLKNMCGIVKAPTGDIIIACYDKRGLHQITSGGAYKSLIAKGSFSDVTVFQNCIYALEYNLSKIIVFEENDKKFKLLREIELKSQNGHNYDKLSVHKAGIYISSWNNHCLQIYNMDGHFQCFVGQKGEVARGYLKYPRLCSCDQFGNALVADNSNRRLQIYNEDGRWHVLNIKAEKAPRDAVIDGTDVWVITSCNSLVKYKKVR